MVTMSKPIDFPTSIYVAKAVWMGVGSQSILPKNGTWHRWINEAYIFIKLILD